jgi:hypothetical protein
MNRMSRFNSSGQVLMEFNIGVALILLPLCFLVAGWFYIQEKKTQCAVNAFQQARSQLIRSHSNVDFTLRCGPVQEKVHLSALESLDHDKGSLGIDDLIDEVSLLSERLSQLLQSVRVQASSSSSTEPKI